MVLDVVEEVIYERHLMSTLNKARTYFEAALLHTQVHLNLGGTKQIIRSKALVKLAGAELKFTICAA